MPWSLETTYDTFNLKSIVGRPGGLSLLGSGHLFEFLQTDSVLFLLLFEDGILVKVVDEVVDTLELVIPNGCLVCLCFKGAALDWFFRVDWFFFGQTSVDCFSELEGEGLLELTHLVFG